MLQLFEYWLHPQRYRTQMCRSGEGCQRSLCFFAHSAAELRVPGSTHELHIPMPPSVMAAAAAGSTTALTALPGRQGPQRASEDALPAPPAAPAGTVHWPAGVEESSSSFSSQASRVPSNLAPGVSSSSGSETDLALLPSGNNPLMVVPGQQSQAALPATAVLMQLHQQELQRRQARYMELQLQQLQKQQQDNMRAALLQLELQQQQQGITGSCSVMPGNIPTSLAGLGQGLGTLSPGNSLGLSRGFMPIISEGIISTSLDQGNMTSPALAAAAGLANPLAGMSVQPGGRLMMGSSMSRSDTALPGAVAPVLTGLANLSLSDVNCLPTSGAGAFGSGGNLFVASELLMGAQGGSLVQSWF
eukprot:GHUV01011554.1.p1 GENE.GHUV01011554.1~~GHUV01011554.1.p1  ORF type:complete len:360 (+),score=142.17 GHUV01011554.1:784-1863(+)